MWGVGHEAEKQNTPEIANPPAGASWGWGLFFSSPEVFSGIIENSVLFVFENTQRNKKSNL